MPPPEGHAAAPVDDVEISVLVERDVHDGAEHLPILAVQHTDGEQFLEVGVQTLIAAGEIDDLLGRQGARGGQGAAKQEQAGGCEGSDGHRVSLLVR